ncbi:MAG TPA: NAD(P)H-hydrate dehydratase [Clostridiales bacterium]|nr:NAD(P)H-hydrate dehydratase [Clostridiales bacterium]
MSEELDKYILGNSETVNLKDCCETIRLTTLDYVRTIIKKRKRDSHKGTYGKVGIVSGSKGMAGAAVLNLNAALRSGSGLVKGFIPESIYNAVESMSIEAVTHTYDEENFSFSALKSELIDYSDVVASGSGCSNFKNYKEVLCYLLDTSLKPLVIDAEGINVMDLGRLKDHRQDIVLTPHYGEMARLINKDVSYVRKDILNVAGRFSAEYNVYLVLKGARTIISSPDGKVFINTTGNPGMATAGSGDVLTGIIASFIGQKINIPEALAAAVFVHGMAGDAAAEQLGEYSLTAGDIIKYLPEAFRKIVI